MKRLWIWLVGLVVLGLVAGALFLLYGQRLGPNVLARVDGKNITKQEVQRRLWVKSNFLSAAETHDVTTADAKASLNELIELAVLDSEVGKLNIPSQKADIENYMKAHGFVTARYLSNDQKEALTDYHKLGYLREAIAKQVVSWKEAEYVQIPLDTRFFKDSPGYISDKEYGKKLADTIYAKWSSGEIDFKAAVSMAKDDPRLGITAVKAINGFEYLEFGYKIDRAGYESMPSGDFKNAFNTFKQGFNQPKVVVGDIINPESGNLDKSGYRDHREIIIAHITSTSAQNSYDSYEAWYKEVKSKHRVKT